MLLAYFREEGKSVAAVTAEMADAPRLAVMQERAAQLTALSEVAQQAITYLSKGERSPVAWKGTSLRLLEEAKKRSAIVQFVFVQPLTDLVNATKQ